MDGWGGNGFIISFISNRHVESDRKGYKRAYGTHAGDCTCLYINIRIRIMYIVWVHMHINILYNALFVTA